MKTGDARGNGTRTPVNPPPGHSGYNPLPIGNPLGQSSAPGSSFPLFQQFARGEHMLSDIFGECFLPRYRVRSLRSGHFARNRWTPLRCAAHGRIKQRRRYVDGSFR